MESLRILSPDMSDVVWVADEKFVSVSIGVNLAGLLGYRPEELTAAGSKFADLVHPQDLPALAEHERRLKTAGRSTLRYRIRHKDGRHVRVEEFARVAGVTESGLSILVGVTRRLPVGRAFNPEQQQIESRLQALIAAIQDYAIVLLDRDGRVVTWNGGAEALLGYREVELVGSHFSAIFPENEAAEAAQLLRIALEDGVLQYEGPVRKRTGEHCRVHMALRPLPAGLRTSGSGFALVLKDSADQYAHEQYLRLAEAGFLFSQNPAICIQRNLATGHVDLVRANELASRILREILGITDLSYAQVEEALKRPSVKGGEELLAKLAERHAFNCEIEISNLPRVHTLEFNANEPHQQDSLSTVQVVLLANNEGQPVEQDRFQHAQRVELVGQLAGGVAHDFNNILVVTLGNLQMLRDELRSKGVDGEAMDLLEEAVRAMRQGESLTRSLTRLSRREPLEIQPIDVNDVLHHAVEICRRTLPSNISLVTELPAQSLPFVNASSGFLESSLLNLVINSRDALPKGGTITLRAEKVQVYRDMQHVSVIPGTYVEITCTDTGCGMTEDTRMHCFEAMYTTKPRGAGTGLGLWAVREFARSCEGDAYVKSTGVDKGTTIAILLPVVRAAEEAETRNPALRGESHRALVVDDNPSVRRLAGRLLSQAGFKIVEAEDADNALATIESSRAPDLVVTDILMPGRINGIDLVEELERSRPALPVILITASQRAAAEARSKFGTRYLVLEKPFEPGAFLAACREAVGT